MERKGYGEEEEGQEAAACHPAFGWDLTDQWFVYVTTKWVRVLSLVPQVLKPHCKFRASEFWWLLSQDRGTGGRRSSHAWSIVDTAMVNMERDPDSGFPIRLLERMSLFWSKVRRTPPASVVHIGALYP